MCEVRPNFLFNSTGQLIRVKQWLPEIKTNPALSEVQNPEKNKAKSTEQTKFSPTRRTRGTKTSSSGATNPHFFSSDIAKKKDNLCRVAKQQKARVSSS
jgi:pyruvate/2-oxoglutarate dehydrogenase complex dihydrolipoamide acyltransferase (E2) component